MSALGDVAANFKVPAAQKGRLSRSELDAIGGRAAASMGKIRGGSAKIRALAALMGVLIEETGGFLTERAKMKAAEAALEAIRLQAEAEAEEGGEG